MFRLFGCFSWTLSLHLQISILFLFDVGLQSLVQTCNIITDIIKLTTYHRRTRIFSQLILSKWSYCKTVKFSDRFLDDRSMFTILQRHKGRWGVNPGSKYWTIVTEMMNDIRVTPVFRDRYVENMITRWLGWIEKVFNLPEIRERGECVQPTSYGMNVFATTMQQQHFKQIKLYKIKLRNDMENNQPKPKWICSSG